MGDGPNSCAVCFAFLVDMTSWFETSNGVEPIFNLSAKRWVGVDKREVLSALLGDSGAIEV